VEVARAQEVPAEREGIRGRPQRVLHVDDERRKVMGEVDNMAFVGILSFQLVYEQFVNSRAACLQPLSESAHEALQLTVA